MKSNFAYSLIGLSILILFSVWFFVSRGKDAPQPPSSQETTTISMTDDGFVPSEVTIQKGDTIVWVNASSDWRWPASNLHPTHLLYPEFDPLKPVAPSESWSFRFEKLGDWRFHDHLRPNKGGVVHVTP